MLEAVLIDRDGVINKDHYKHIKDWSQFEFLPGSLEALKKLSKYKLFIITNQAGISRGLATQSEIESVHSSLLEELLKNNVKIEKVYVCPHKAEDNCACRKPKPGMIHQAAKEFGLDTGKCLLIGDKTSDVEAGKSAGCMTILVMTGYAGKDKEGRKPDFVARDLLHASEIVKSYDFKANSSGI